MTQTTLTKIKDQGKFRLSKRSQVIYTKQTKWRRSSGLIAIVFTADESGRTYKKRGGIKVWPVTDPNSIKPNSKSTGSTVARKPSKAEINYKK